jgi:hypothetical protein
MDTLSRDCIRFIFKQLLDNTSSINTLDLFSFTVSCKHVCNFVQQDLSDLKITLRENMSIVSKTEDTIHLILRVYEIKKNNELDSFFFSNQFIYPDFRGHLHIELSGIHHEYLSPGYKKVEGEIHIICCDPRDDTDTIIFAVPVSTCKANKTSNMMALLDEFFCPDEIGFRDGWAKCHLD